ncbi:MAG: efflux RND transporter permease subunit [Muribaculaceae bacterium]|nr:efflux RND transporter permease subunit [Muribaculaceae bacterium]
MNNGLIKRPIAVSMVLIAITVVALVAMRKIPVSLMPDIAVPQITVQAVCPGYAVNEVEESYTKPLRQQLLQVAGLKDIQSESRMDAGTIRLLFEPGSDMDIIFIEVNEKVDRAMRFLPKDADRPKVMKAGAMDIPAFYLDISLKEEPKGSEAGMRFAGLARFARDVVAKRIEQLPQTAMVDVSGIPGTEIECIPDPAKMDALGLTASDIERAISDNNITLGALSIVDGIYRYNIHFDSQILTKEDIAAIYINHGGRLVTLREICDITERTATRSGLVRSDGHNAVTMAVVKQNDAQMKDLQEGMAKLLEDLGKEFPEINFQLTRDQTQLLSYSISNLEQNLLLGAILACLILFLFMRDWRPTILIIITIPVSLLITLLFFHLLNISINVISLSGLILGVGMMVDNSIIVIDNIRQKQTEEKSLSESITEGTREVFVPMLSSVLTTCSVFIPLMFLSGTAGALFYDQAMAVAIALFSSLGVSVLVIPVYYYSFYRSYRPNGANRDNVTYKSKLASLYDRIHSHVFRHAWIYIIAGFLCIPLSALLFVNLDKERMPYIAPEDTLVEIDWNAGISAEENDRRISELLAYLSTNNVENDENPITHSTVMAGVQQFLLPHTKELTTSEAIIYLKCKDAEALENAKGKIEYAVAKDYPKASVSFESSGNLYELVFQTGGSDLEIRIQTAEGSRPKVAESRAFIDSLRRAFPDINIRPVVTEENLQYLADSERMTLYKVGYRQLYAHLREAVHKNKVFEISDGPNSIPIMVGKQGNESDRIMGGSVKNDEGIDIPLSLILRQSRREDYKRLSAAGTGDYYPIEVNAGSKEIREVMDYTDRFVKRHAEYTATYDGEYFKSRKLIGELAIVLAVSLALLYFILAAQFESLVQPLIILFEMVIDVCLVFIVLWLTGETLNIMSMTGLIVMAGIIINDSILKIDTINRLRRAGMPLLKAVNESGHKRLRPILMTSLTTILALLPFLHRGDMGSALQYPLSLTLVVGMTVGTAVSLFIVPLLYYQVYKVYKPYRANRANGTNTLQP